MFKRKHEKGKKAFDSVDRGSLIKAMKRYECDPMVIEIVEKLYKGDRTNVLFESEKLFKIEVTSGIRHGCTLSPILFIMVANLIIRRVQKS